ncbi:unnamed protein product [Chrysoparadoxa australica]
MALRICRALTLAAVTSYSRVSVSAFIPTPSLISGSVTQSLCRMSASAAATTPMQITIEEKLTQGLQPTHLDVINESHMHAGSATESHFKVVVVSDAFEGKPLIARHRMVNKLLKDQLETTLHALSIQSKTPEQWEKEGGKVLPSPDCMGGSKG